MAWRWPGDKPLSKPVMIILLTHICIARPQWVNAIPQIDTTQVVEIHSQKQNTLYM